MCPQRRIDCIENYKLANQLQKNLIIDLSDIEDPQYRFTLLDVPPGDELSSETRMAPYRNPLVNIRTGMVTKNTETGERLIKVKTERLNWTLPKKQIGSLDYGTREEESGITNMYIQSNITKTKIYILILEIRSPLFSSHRELEVKFHLD